jgi:hypothetical protein
MLSVSFALILGWIAQSVKPFSFQQVPGELLPPTFQGERGSMRQQPGLFEKASRRQANELQNVHLNR